MSDKGIIFSAPMVRALFDGRKTQTRRLLKPQPPEWATFCQQPAMLNVEHKWVPSGLWRWSEPEKASAGPLRQWPVDQSGEHYWLRLPYAPCDRLYVREGLYCPNDAGWWYRADDAPLELARTDPRVPQMVAWAHHKEQNYTPSIHMPRWASRLTLLVTDVRMQRVAEISEEDARAEGLIETHEGWAVDRDGRCWGYCARNSFRLLWNSLHTKPGERWEDNPWVVAVTFDVYRDNIDRLAA